MSSSSSTVGSKSSEGGGQSRNREGDAVADLSVTALGAGALYIVFHILKALWFGVCKLAEALWNAAVIAVQLLALCFALAVGFDFGRAGYRWVKKRQNRHLARDLNPYPTFQAFTTGIGVNGVDHEWGILVRDDVHRKYGYLPAGEELTPSSFAYLSREARRRIDRDPVRRAIVAQKLYSPLYGLYQTRANDRLNEWVDSVAAGQRRLHFFFVTLRLASVVSRGLVGIAPGDGWVELDKNALRADLSRFLAFCETHAQSAMGAVAEILQLPAPPQDVQSNDALTETEPAPQLLLPAPKPEPVASTTPDDAETASNPDKDQTSDSVGGTKAADDAEQLLVESDSLMAPTNSGWADPHKHIEKNRDYVATALAHHRDPEACRCRLARYDAYLSVLPEFDDTFDTVLAGEETWPSWMQRAVDEFSSDIEAFNCRPQFKRVACACFLEWRVGEGAVSNPSTAPVDDAEKHDETDATVDPRVAPAKAEPDDVSENDIQETEPGIPHGF